MDDFDDSSNPMQDGSSDAATSAQTNTSASQASATCSDNCAAATLADDASGGASAATQIDVGTDAQSLAAAGQDADLHAGSGDVGDPVTGCSDGSSSAQKQLVVMQGTLGNAPTPAAGFLPGALEVTVLNALDGTPLSGATVTAQSASQVVSGTTDAAGTVSFSPLAPDSNYLVIASNFNFTLETTSVNVPPGSESNAIETVLALTPIMLTLQAPKNPMFIACPGHPLEMVATGTPSGGDYAWTLSGDGELTESNGVTPLNTGPKVYLASYGPNNVQGWIPHQRVTVTVTYTVGRGSVSTSQLVEIHDIHFIASGTVRMAPIKANEDDPKTLHLQFDHATNIPEMQVEDSQIQIVLESSCPRKTACARTYQVGWLQTVVASYVQARYDDTEIDMVLKEPSRDADREDKLPPFVEATFVRRFLRDGDIQEATQIDSPGYHPDWFDQRPGAPPGSRLASVFFAMTLTSWLVVQNREWSAHDSDGSFVFLGNVGWSVVFRTDIDWTQPQGKMCNPQSAPVIIIVPYSKGKGNSDPVLTGKIAPENTDVTVVP